MFGKIIDYDFIGENKYILLDKGIKINFSVDVRAGSTYWTSFDAVHWKHNAANPFHFLGKKLVYLTITKPDCSVMRIGIFNAIRLIEDMEIDTLHMQILSGIIENKIICSNVLLITGKDGFREKRRYPRINLSIEFREKCLEK